MANNNGLDLKKERRKAVLIKRDIIDDATKNKGGVFEEKDLTKVFEASAYIDMEKNCSYEDFQRDILAFAGGVENLQKWANRNSGIQRLVLTALQLGSDIEKQNKDDLIDLIYQREIKGLYNM